MQEQNSEYSGIERTFVIAIFCEAMARLDQMESLWGASHPLASLTALDLLVAKVSVKNEMSGTRSFQFGWGDIL